MQYQTHLSPIRDATDVVVLVLRVLISVVE